jgi:glycosyltransferase involved in cell wall biosynthesis
MKPKISVIATTYNQPDELDLYLNSLRSQTEQGFEICIADDGSDDRTRAVILRHVQEFFGNRLRHVWHPDQGYQKSRIVNQAALLSQGEWLIFTDSDLFVERHFVEDHGRMSAKNRLFMGRRVDLGKAVSDRFRREKQTSPSVRFWVELLLSQRAHDTPSRNVHRAVRIHSESLAKTLGCLKVPDLLGSNFSIDRELFIKLNGFNEALKHYWGEDGDLFVRARNSGAEILGRKNYAVQFHLWHPLRSPAPGAEEEYRRRVEQDHETTRCDAGLDQHRL